MFHQKCILHFDLLPFQLQHLKILVCCKKSYHCVQLYHLDIEIVDKLSTSTPTFWNVLMKSLKHVGRFSNPTLNCIGKFDDCLLFSIKVLTSDKNNWWTWELSLNWLIVSLVYIWTIWFVILLIYFLCIYY